jgi:hypothetical protein
LSSNVLGGDAHRKETIGSFLVGKELTALTVKQQINTHSFVELSNTVVEVVEAHRLNTTGHTDFDVTSTDGGSNVSKSLTLENSSTKNSYLKARGTLTVGRDESSGVGNTSYKGGHSCEIRKKNFGASYWLQWHLLQRPKQFQPERPQGRQQGLHSS